MPQRPIDHVALTRALAARWVSRAETQGLRAATWVLLGGSFLLQGTAGTLAFVLALVALLAQTVWGVAVARRAGRALVSADGARLGAAIERLRALPVRRRTLEELEAALGGPPPAAPAPPADATPDPGAMTCYDRGSHVPGCPHQSWG